MGILTNCKRMDSVKSAHQRVAQSATVKGNGKGAEIRNRYNQVPHLTQVPMEK